MNAVATAPRMSDVAHEHRGDLYREGEDPTDTARRIRAHLREAFPKMTVAMRRARGANCRHLFVSITRFGTADLSDRSAGFAVRGLVDAELARFKRYDWDPLIGVRNQSLGTGTSIDPVLHAAALDGVPDLKPLVSFAEFTRTARAGDVLEHVSGRVPSRGPRLMITAISARRLTTRPADTANAGSASRVPIQGGACFASDGDLVCFKHSGFAHQGGYSLLRWIRTPEAISKS
ncbi:hypothetical protein [Sphingomonas bacterium]|uniref:hypothetical protein n=1 Tax=Sphingomonas bacterium TaxID=1895847 RepID=UPI001575269F|nr:hypothetical protein [Sphingomonas bacterium]